jgi:pimeloyl-ACP methyl ester carboxylesterase
MAGPTLSSDRGAKRVPVLLVPGWSDRPRVLGRLHARFIEAGWPHDAVTVVEFRDRYGSNVEHAAEVAAALDALLERCGGSVADIVAHSMGGLAVRHYLAGTAEHRVRRAVFLGTPHAGTWAALLAWGGGRREMLPGSEFLRTLPPPCVACTTIRATFDLRILPGTSARLGGAPDVLLKRATHQGLLRSRAGFAAILEALEGPDGREEAARAGSAIPVQDARAGGTAANGPALVRRDAS